MIRLYKVLLKQVIIQLIINRYKNIYGRII